MYSERGHVKKDQSTIPVMKRPVMKSRSYRNRGLSRETLNRCPLSSNNVETLPEWVEVMWAVCRDEPSLQKPKLMS